MDERIKKAFDQVHAEEDLKEKTAGFLRMERERREKEGMGRERRQRPAPFPVRFAAALASVIVLVMAGVSYNAYFTPAAYVDLDVNPSISIGLNRFSRVVEASAYNDDGERILEDTDLRHSSYDSAVGTLLEAIIEKGYVGQDGLVSVTVQADGGAKEAELVARIQGTVTAALIAHHSEPEIEVYAVSSDVRAEASAHHLSPAKYLAIAELQTLDDTATFEDCASHSIHEIRQITNQHREGHHGSSQTQVIEESGGSGGRNHH